MTASCEPLTHRCDWCDGVLDPVVRHAQRHTGGGPIRPEHIRAAERETGMTTEINR